ncbi:hypothetical protein KGF54_005622 [Candida jiufengensis]|uniref:uncharacterized protein n=1 Tax=Candida jiufengensis TaxID=497108 RepID=UPI0022257B57|nr:uncharacterized protein KGF54_005622 [Candida jiufengensis]KAI5949387.1 hypothetical protein KGF54_005622 [Candida jiufengensis]
MSLNYTDSNTTYALIISFIDLYFEDNQIDQTTPESNCNTVLSDISLPTPESIQQTNEKFNQENLDEAEKEEEETGEEETGEEDTGEEDTKEKEIKEEAKEKETGEKVQAVIEEESGEEIEEDIEEKEASEKYAQATIGRNFNLTQICNDEEDHLKKVEEQLGEGKQDYEDTTSDKKFKHPFSERCKKFCKKRFPFLLSKETDDPEDILKVLFKTHHNITIPGYENLDNKNQRTFVLNKKDFKKMNDILNNIYSPDADVSNETQNKTSKTNKVKNVFKKLKCKKSGKNSKSNIPPPKSILKNAQNINYSLEKENCKEADKISYAQFWNKLNEDEAINKKREDDDYYFTPRLDQVRSYYQSIN